MEKSDLEQRMRKYEIKYNLPEHMPLILRIDGRSFHSFTRNMKKPFDLKFIDMMDTVAKNLCVDIQNCRLAYIQSDEISFLIIQKKESSAWFDNRLDKICSNASARASSVATQYVIDNMDDRFIKRLPIGFDARVNIYPLHEIVNYYIWRQQDYERNSLQMLARSLYSHRELENKSSNDLHDMIHQKNDNWNNLMVFLKRGRCAVKVSELKEIINPRDDKTMDDKIMVTRSKWVVDANIPVFTKDKDYIKSRMLDDYTADASAILKGVDY